MIKILEWKSIAMRGRRGLLTGLCLTFVLFTLSCGDKTQTKDYDTDEGAENANVKKGVKPQADTEVAVIDTEFGQIVIELYPNIAPQTVERFKKLTAEGFYNGMSFHRVEPLVIQAGDPSSRDDDPTNDGGGGSPYANLPAEPSDIPFESGVVGAADAGLGTANSQFFITITPSPGWAGRYTSFGRVIKGLDNARIISGAPTYPGSKNPNPKIVIKNITLQPRANFQ